MGAVDDFGKFLRVDRTRERSSASVSWREQFQRKNIRVDGRPVFRRWRGDQFLLLYSVSCSDRIERKKLVWLFDGLRAGRRLALAHFVLARRRERIVAWCLDALGARFARHGAGYKRAGRARVVPDRDQRRRVMVLHHEVSAVGQSRSFRYSARNKLIIRVRIIIANG